MRGVDFGVEVVRPFASEAEVAYDFWAHFVADLVIECNKEGYIAGTNPMEDEGVFEVFNRRSGPIFAAISISIDAPAGAA